MAARALSANCSVASPALTEEEAALIWSLPAGPLLPQNCLSAWPTHINIVRRAVGKPAQGGPRPVQYMQDTQQHSTDRLLGILLKLYNGRVVGES